MTSDWIEYDYAYVRVVPRVELGAFMNIGVVLHARTESFLDARIDIDVARMEMVARGVDVDLVARYADAIVAICRAEAAYTPISMMPPSERFHWITAPRSSAIQCSPVHPGICRDPAEALVRLFDERVSR
jgi:hypothetical protein